jgi:hypothetical protein
MHHFTLGKKNTQSTKPSHNIQIRYELITTDQTYKIKMITLPKNPIKENPHTKITPKKIKSPANKNVFS